MLFIFKKDIFMTMIMAKFKRIWAHGLGQLPPIQVSVMNYRRFISRYTTLRTFGIIQRNKIFYPSNLCIQCFLFIFLYKKHF